MNTFKTHLKNVFTPYEIKLLRYFYLCIAYEGSKFIVMLFFFKALHFQNEFLTEIFVLLTLRNFYGGIHFRHYVTCFAFTFGFITAGLFLAHYVFLNSTAQIIILFLAFITSCIIRPIASSNRPPLSAKQKTIYHICGILMLLLHTLCFILFKTFPYRNICFWVIVLHTLQLIVAKTITKGGKNHEKKNIQCND